MSRGDLDFNDLFPEILTVPHLVLGSLKRTVLKRRIIGRVSSSLWYIIGRVAGAISPKTLPIIELCR
jgi:hypothetical protein